MWETVVLEKTILSWHHANSFHARPIPAIGPVYAGVDEKQYQKNSFKSCEVLCCEVNEMYSVLMREEDLLEKLFSFLDNPKPLNLTRAGYFARVVSCLLMKRASEVLAFLESRRSIIDKLLAHLDTTSTAEVRALR